MGKDVRGIERGKCACDECGDFRRSDGVTCGFVGVCRLAILKRMPATLTLLVTREQVKVQVQSNKSSLETDFIPEPCTV